MFQPIDQHAADLRAHIRYPDDLFRAQTARYVTYHMNTPATFYNREDEWQIPVVTRNDQAVPFMRHIVMRLPDEKAAEFIYMAPFTPRGKDNLAAWMVARNDGENYGKLRVYRFPRQSLVFGPRQIENRINQDTEISRQVSLWDQRGSQVIRGDLLVIPIEESLLYVQPMYLQAEGGQIPELKRVVVAYQNQVIMRETLDAALSDMFGGSVDSRRQVIAAADSAGVGGAPGAGGAAQPAATLDAATQSTIAEAQRRYQAAHRRAAPGRLGALRRGDPPARRRARAAAEQPALTAAPRRRTLLRRRGPAVRPSPPEGCSAWLVSRPARRAPSIGVDSANSVLVTGASGNSLSRKNLRRSRHSGPRLAFLAADRRRSGRPTTTAQSGMRSLPTRRMPCGRHRRTERPLFTAGVERQTLRRARRGWRPPSTSSAPLDHSGNTRVTMITSSHPNPV